MELDGLRARGRAKFGPPAADAFGRGFNPPGSVPVNIGGCWHVGDLPEAYDVAGVVQRKYYRKCGSPFSSAWIGSPPRTLDGEEVAAADGLMSAVEDPAQAAKNATQAASNATFDAIFSAAAAGQSAAMGARDMLADINNLTTGGVEEAFSKMKGLVTSEACPLCGHINKAPPAVSLPKVVAVWLQDLERIQPSAAEDGRRDEWPPLLPASGVMQPDDPRMESSADSVLLAPELGDKYQNGQLVYEVMKRLYRLQGLRPRKLELNSNMTPGGRLANWKLVLPYLRDHFGIELAAREPSLSDKKALLVSGEWMQVVELLVKLKARVQQEKPDDANAKTSRLDIGASNDTKELIQDSATQLIGMYAIVMACLLSIFVNQTCPANSTVNSAHPCSLGSGDFTSAYQRAVVVVNFVTLGVVVAAQLVFWKREKFLIQHFDVSPDEAIDNLAREIELYPSYRERLELLNWRTYVVSELVFAAIVVNFGLSAYMILGLNYSDQTSVIGLLSNTLLCLGKVWGYRTVSRQCMDKRLAISLFEVTPKQMNTIEQEKKYKEGVYVNPALKDLDKDPNGAVKWTPVAAAPAPAPAKPPVSVPMPIAAPQPAPAAPPPPPPAPQMRVQVPQPTQSAVQQQPYAARVGQPPITQGNRAGASQSPPPQRPPPPQAPPPQPQQPILATRLPDLHPAAAQQRPAAPAPPQVPGAIPPQSIQRPSRGMWPTNFPF